MKASFAKTSLIVLSFLLFFSCRKEDKTLVDQTPDPYAYSSDLQSSKDISFATSVIADIDMMCAYASQGTAGDYEFNPALTSDKVLVIRDTSLNPYWLTLSFNNNNNNSCLDGRSRKGSVFMFYGYDKTANPSAGKNSKFYESYEFSARLAFNNFSVDGWEIELFDPAIPAYIKNTLDGDLYDPKITKLTWEIDGKFRFTNSADPSRNLVWGGKIKKILRNTDDTAVFANKNAMVHWNLAKIEYVGTANGSYLSPYSLYSYSINGANPLYRDMTCNYSPEGSVNVTRYHPFVFGTCILTLDNYHPRTLDYGPNLSCDNKFNISFKDESHTEVLE